MTFGTLYWYYFKKEATSKVNILSLKMAKDVVLQPCDKFEVLSDIFTYNKQKSFGSVTLVGQVIS